MRNALPILLIVVFGSCGQETEKSSTTSDNTSPINSLSNTKLDTTKTDLSILEWEKHQDSLRNQILKRKENRVLKESFLQEMYIRNVVSVIKDSLLVDIPFNLHGPDCGAPDCYSTDVSFSLKLGDTLVFPGKLPFQEFENGCIAKETRLSGTLNLLEQTDKHVIYHSIKNKRTLVLFSSNKESGTIAYYFTNVDQYRITGNNVYKITREHNEDDKKSIYPFTSWVLTINEYEDFL